MARLAFRGVVVRVEAQDVLVCRDGLLPGVVVGLGVAQREPAVARIDLRERLCGGEEV